VKNRSLLLALGFGGLGIIGLLMALQPSTESPVKDALNMPKAPIILPLDTSSKAFSGKSLNMGVVDLNKYKGKVVLVDFWATWCPPCIKEVPHFVSLQKKLGPKGFQIVGVSLDEGSAVVEKFITKFDVNYPIVMGNQKLVELYGGVQAIPTTFLLDKQLKIVNKWVGYHNESDFEKAIKKYL